MNSYQQFKSLFPDPFSIIGMIHLPPLPGFKGSPGLSGIIDRALADLEIYQQAGIHGVLIENEYDRPHLLKSNSEVTAAMTRVTAEVVKMSKFPVGVEILLNDPEASLAVAKMAGAQFIRTDYYSDPMYREGYGEMEINPEALLSYREKILATEVFIWADIQVKYAQMITPISIADSADRAVQAKADAIIVTGEETGNRPLIDDVVAAKNRVRDFPVLLGSGIDEYNISDYSSKCDGAIIGTGLQTDQRVDAEKVKRCVGKLLSPLSAKSVSQ